jgi:hypothetical protein
LADSHTVLRVWLRRRDAPSSKSDIPARFGPEDL